MCPGDTVVYSCITDTGYLVWYITGEERQLYESGPVPQVTHKDIFTLQLITVNGSVLISTATVPNVSLEYDGKNITCGDSVVITANTNEQMKTIIISMSTCTCKI